MSFDDGYRQGWRAAAEVALAGHQRRTYWQGMTPEFQARLDALQDDEELADVSITESMVKHYGCSCGANAYPCPIRLALEAGPAEVVAATLQRTLDRVNPVLGAEVRRGRERRAMKSVSDLEICEHGIFCDHYGNDRIPAAPHTSHSAWDQQVNGLHQWRDGQPCVIRPRR